jgi:serine/threonine protein kinase
MRTVLTDFGIAKLLRGTTGGTQTEGLTGTLDYMAPEQIRISRDLDGRADVYALGVVLFQVLTGKLPFEASNPAALMMAHLQEQPPDPRSVNPDLPKSVAGAILTALAKDPRDRMPTAGLLLEAIL